MGSVSENDLLLTAESRIPVIGGDVLHGIRATDNGFLSFGVYRFRVEEIGENFYARITVPPGIWFGFQVLSYPRSLLLNVADIEHNPAEVQRLDIRHFDIDWGQL